MKPDGTVNMLLSHLSVWAVAQFVPSGDMNGDGKVDIADALIALKMAAGIITPTAADLAVGDVAPLSGGIPNPNGIINVGDVVVIMEKAVGLVTW